jgi:indole-3-glycerol phosphate synthase
MTILDRIVADTRVLVADRKARVPVRALEDSPLFPRPTASLARALRQPHLAILAELKPASPSQGLLRAPFDVADLAGQYADAGVEAISVLTEPLHFRASPDHLRRARAAVDLPLLRKDFILDVYQLVEAKAYGADAVLLIATVLDRPALRDLHQAATALGLDCLVEVYAQAELDRIDFDQVTILGVNNRNLHTFEVDLHHAPRVFAHVPPTVIRVAESGMKTADELAFLRRQGLDAVLIGEAFMRAEKPGEALAALKQAVAALLDAEPAP